MRMTESHNLNADICDATGNQKVMLHASYSARVLDIHVEVLDADYAQRNPEAVRGDTATFLREALSRASGELTALPEGGAIG